MEAAEIVEWDVVCIEIDEMGRWYLPAPLIGKD